MSPGREFCRALIAGVLSLLALASGAVEYAPTPAPTALALGIMQGRPVPADKRVTLANWMSPPFNRWSLQHVSQILPVATVYRGDGPVAPLPERSRDLASLRFEAAPGETLTIGQWLAASCTDGFIVLQDGAIVFEAYLNDMQPQTPHLSYSVSKSVVGILAGILAEAGALDPARSVEYYVPELKGSGFAGYRVRDLLDMLAAIDWDENYTDPDGSWRRWKDAIGWTPAAGDAAALPDGNYGFLPTLRRDPDWPGGFKYVSPSAEVLGWVLERAGGMPLAELMSRKLWIPLGAQGDAFFTTDRAFAPAAAGGLGATLRDLARFGQMVLNAGRFNGRQIVSREWIADIRFNGNREAWRTGQYRGFWNPAGAYRSLWYVAGDAGGSFEAIGIHGQRLYINPALNMVVVRLASAPEPVSRKDYDLSSRAIAAIGAEIGAGASVSLSETLHPQPVTTCCGPEFPKAKPKHRHLFPLFPLQFDQCAAEILRVQEHDGLAVRSGARFTVTQHAGARGLQPISGLEDVRHLVAQVVHATGRTGLKELPDRGFLAQRMQQFDPRVRQFHEHGGDAVLRQRQGC